MTRLAARLRLRPTAEEPTPCGRCGALFRAGHTEGRCPICDWSAEIETGPESRASRALSRWWAPGLIALTIAGNIAVFVLVAAKLSSR